MKSIQKQMKDTMSLFSKDNLPRLLIMVVLLFLLYYVYTTYLKEGFMDVKPAEFTGQVGDKKTLVLKLKNPLPVGSYTIRWGVTDESGAPLKGSIDFRVE
jgi:methionine-rich copper-binding protein CopC